MSAARGGKVIVCVGGSGIEVVVVVVVRQLQALETREEPHLDTVVGVAWCSLV